MNPNPLGSNELPPYKGSCFGRQLVNSSNPAIPKSNAKRPYRPFLLCTINLSVADWYYIGHYGQLGPLTFEQVEELVQGGVIGRDTFVWRHGLSDWQAADRVTELSAA